MQILKFECFFLIYESSISLQVVENPRITGQNTFSETRFALRGKFEPRLSLTELKLTCLRPWL